MYVFFCLLLFPSVPPYFSSSLFILYFIFHPTFFPLLFLEPRQLSRYSDWATSWTVRVSNPGRDNRYCSSPKRPGQLWVPPSLLFSGCRASFQRLKRPGREVDHKHFYLTPRLRMNASIPLFLLDAVGLDSSVAIATRYELDGPGIEFRWERDFPYPSIAALGPT